VGVLKTKQLTVKHAALHLPISLPNAFSRVLGNESKRNVWPGIIMVLQESSGKFAWSFYQDRTWE
jgi:hypothetical protein